RSVRREGEIELTLFADALRGAEEEGALFNYRGAEREAVVVALELRRGEARAVRTVEGVVPVEERGDAVPVVRPALGDDVDDAAGGVAELSLGAGRQPLKLGDRLLVELRRRAARHRVLVR